MTVPTVQCWSPLNATSQLGHPLTAANVFNMNWANCASGNPADTISEAGDRLQGNKTSGLASNPNGAVLLYGYEWSAPLFQATFSNLQAAVPSSVLDYHFFLAVFQGLAKRGATPTAIVTDFEGASPAGWNWLDPAMNLATRNGARAQYAAIAFAAQDAGFPNGPPPIVGSGIVPQAFTYSDPNGFAYTPCGPIGYSAGGVHSPMLYLNGGNAYNAGPLDSTWNNFIGIINGWKAGFGGDIEPWIAPASYLGDGVTPKLTNVGKLFLGELLKHGLAMGIKRFLYWNPTRIAGDDTLFAQLLSAAEALNPSVVTAVSPTPYNSSSIFTGSVTTQYSTYLAAKALDNLPPARGALS